MSTASPCLDLPCTVLHIFQTVSKCQNIKTDSYYRLPLLLYSPQHTALPCLPPRTNPYANLTHCSENVARNWEIQKKWNLKEILSKRSKIQSGRFQKQLSVVDSTDWGPGTSLWNPSVCTPHKTPIGIPSGDETFEMLLTGSFGPAGSQPPPPSLSPFSGYWL